MILEAHIFLYNPVHISTGCNKCMLLPPFFDLLSTNYIYMQCWHDQKKKFLRRKSARSESHEHCLMRQKAHTLCYHGKYFRIPVFLTWLLSFLFYCMRDEFFMFIYSERIHTTFCRSYVGLLKWEDIS